jgi:DNA-binding NarL/FixJ family response regulator
MHEEDHLVLAARDAGAVGYLLKTASSHEVVDAVGRVLAGETVFPALSAPVARGSVGTAAPARGGQDLSAREQQILQLLADGRSPDEVAATLVISPKTVRNHLSRAYDKLGVDNRTQAIVVALQRGLIELA